MVPSLEAVAIGKISGSGCKARIHIRVKAFIENPERRKESSHCDRDVRIRDVVGLQVVEVLVYRPTERPALSWTLELSFKLATRFHQPSLAQWQKQNGIELRVEQCSAPLSCRKESGLFRSVWERGFSVLVV